MMRVPEQYRITNHPQLGTRASDGCNGAFRLPPLHPGRYLCCIVSNGANWKQDGLPGEPWEHVTVHAAAKDGLRCWTPTWNEMAYVKDAFWTEEECVVQFHPPHSVYVNSHPHTLHLWRPTGAAMAMPPQICV